MVDAATTPASTMDAGLKDLLASKASTLRELRARLSCCGRCALRFASIREPAAYLLSESEFEVALPGPTGDEEGTHESEAKLSPPPAVCPVCLGCLQHCTRPDAVAKVAAAVRGFGYDMRSFTLAVSLPVQLLVRERSAWLHLQRAAAAAAALSGAGITGVVTKAGSQGESSLPRRLDHSLPSSRAQHLPPLPAFARSTGCAHDTALVHAFARVAEAAGGVKFESIIEVKEALRYTLTEPLARELGVPMDAASALMITLGVTHAATDGEHHSFVRALLPNQSDYNKRKRWAHGQPADLDSLRAVRSVIATDRADNLLKSSSLCPPPPISAPSSVGVTVEREAITLTGRYRKYSRTLPQSPWIVDGGRKCAGSVAECITEHAVPLFGATEGKFHSAGREDVDVRMLGTGRPFMVELLSPRTAYRTDVEIAELQVSAGTATARRSARARPLAHAPRHGRLGTRALAHAPGNRPAQIEALQPLDTLVDAHLRVSVQARINAGGLIEIDGLHECSHALVSTIMKEGEEAHRKDYRCVVSLNRRLSPADLLKINSTSELVAKQLTPMRVLHRRTLMVRERSILS